MLLEWIILLQLLLKAFFQNVTSNEAVIRRAAANMILITCLNCRKPQQFLNCVVEQLIGNSSAALNVIDYIFKIIMVIIYVFRFCINIFFLQKCCLELLRKIWKMKRVKRSI